jgi:hypothetical protein
MVARSLGTWSIGWASPSTAAATAAAIAVWEQTAVGGGETVRNDMCCFAELPCILQGCPSGWWTLEAGFACPLELARGRMLDLAPFGAGLVVQVFAHLTGVYVFEFPSQVSFPALPASATSSFRPPF